MKVYRIKSLNTIGLDEMEAQPVGEKCIKLKNLICGISTSDVQAYMGSIPVQYPIIPVRQCVGFVSEVGERVSGISRGNRVVVYPQASCHKCKTCKEGRYYDCEKPSVFGLNEDGFLSDFAVVSSDDVYTIPDRLKDEEAIYTEHTAIAINTISQLNIEKGEHIVIVGATSVGIILAQVAMYYQAVPIVVDMRDDMLDVARRAGVYYVINAVNDDVSKKILSLTGGHMADACAYMLSSTMPLRNVFDFTAINGRIALVGKTYSELKCDISAIVNRKQNIITVTDCGKNYPSAINMLANHTVAVDIIPNRIVDFNDVPTAFDDISAEPDGKKLLIKIK